jgi:hypothetical protein
VNIIGGAEILAERISGKCGHTTQSATGSPLVCDKAKGHTGLHEQRDRLRDGIVRTNWRDDGKATWAP